MKKNIKKNAFNAFTLIELLAVILILGIIALIAIPTVNKVLKESKMGALNTTAVTLGAKAEEACQLENLKDEETTSLYTIVEGKLDKPLEIKGDLPREGYILVNDKCEVAYSFYNENNVVSKNFKESKAIVNNKDTAPAYGLKWQSNKSTLDDTYTRTLDANGIDDDSVNVQVGDTPVTNAFDTLDIYKDILPYTDSFGNEFMLIPKFYISKTKEVTDTEVVWNYAVSKHKLDDTYYLPSNFVDEGEDNNKHIELPYVLVGKYEAGSNGASGDAEMLVSKSGLMPKVNITINQARDMATRYNDIEGISGYQQYDIHVHDLLTMLFAIEYKTMNSQNVMRGYVDNLYEVGAIATGGSDRVTSSSGSLASDNSPFHYRGIENLWGNVWAYMDGVMLDQINDTKDSIYTILNSKHYSSNSITNYHNKLEEYNKLNQNGFIVETGYDSSAPFINFPTKINTEKENGFGDYYHQDDSEDIKVMLIGGMWSYNYNAGIYNIFSLWTNGDATTYAGARLVKTPQQNIN